MATTPRIAGVVKYGTNNTISPVDVYGNDRTTPTNLIVNSIDDATITALQNSLNNPALSDASKLVAGLVGVLAGQDSATARNRIKSALGDSKGILSEIGQNTLNNVLSNMGVTDLGRDVISNVIGAKGSLTSEQIKQKYGNNPIIKLEDQIRRVKNGEYDSASEIVKIIGAVTNTTGTLFLDVASEFALAYEIVEKANRLGITEGVDVALTGVDPQRQKDFLLEGTKLAVLRGDLVFVKKAFDELGAAALLAVEPGLYKKMMFNYRPNLSLSPRESVAELLALFNDMDEKWYVVNTNGLEAIDVGLFDGISNDVADGLAATPSTQVISTIGFKLTGFKAEYEKRYS